MPRMTFAKNTAPKMKNAQIELVTFVVGNETYAIDIMDVQEIDRIHEVRAVPNVPSYVEGLFFLRGDMIPIISLHRRFNLMKPVLTEDEELLSGFVIIDIDGTKLGVIIDRVERVIAVDLNEVQAAPPMLTGIGTEYISGVINRKEAGYIILLNIRKIFSTDELQKIAATAQANKA